MNMTRKAARSVHKILALDWDRGSPPAKAVAGRAVDASPPTSHVAIQPFLKKDLITDQDIQKPPLLKVNALP
jgi:hypothetical protein